MSPMQLLQLALIAICVSCCTAQGCYSLVDACQDAPCSEWNAGGDPCAGTAPGAVCETCIANYSFTQESGQVYENAGIPGGAFDGTAYVINCHCDQAPAYTWDVNFDAPSGAVSGPYTGYTSGGANQACYAGASNFAVFCHCNPCEDDSGADDGLKALRVFRAWPIVVGVAGAFSLVVAIYVCKVKKLLCFKPAVYSPKA